MELATEAKQIIKSVLRGANVENDVACIGDELIHTSTRTYNGGLSAGDYLMLLFLCGNRLKYSMGNEKIYITFKDENKVKITGIKC